MSQTLRVHTIDRMLRNRHHVTIQDFLDELEVSLPTLKRDLSFMRLQLNAPIVFDKSLKAYRFENEQQTGPRYELPGLWLDPTEAYALLSAHALLEGLEPRLLGPHIAPIKERLTALIAMDNVDDAEIHERIQIISSLRKKTSEKVFEVVAQATLKGLRLILHYADPVTQVPVSREQSPQRLTFYRENWFVDVWCHAQEAFRNIALDAIEHAELMPVSASRLPREEVDAVLNSGYGTVIGIEQKTAVLDFSPHRMAHMSRLTWHEDIKRTQLDNGWCRIELIYNHDTELIRDILSHGSDVIVQAPDCLRKRVMEALAKASSHYR